MSFSPSHKMGKKPAIKDLAAKLGFSEKYVQDQIKPDFFDFVENDLEGPLTTVELDRIQSVVSDFIDSDAGCKHFKHNRAKNELHFRCSQSSTKAYLCAIVKIWLKSKATTARRNEIRCQSNILRPDLPKTAFGTASKSVDTIVDRDGRSSTPLDEAEPLSVDGDRLAPQQRPRSQSVETDDMYGPLPDIQCRPLEDEVPCRPSEDEDFIDVEEMLNRRLKETSKLQIFSTPLRSHTGDTRQELPSPPTTGRKRIYEIAATSEMDGVCANATAEAIPAKRARVSFAPFPTTSRHRLDSPACDGQIDLTLESNTSYHKPTEVRVNIPALPRQRRSSQVTGFRSLQSPPVISEVIAVENTTVISPNLPSVSEEITTPSVQEVTPPFEQRSHISLNSNTSLPQPAGNVQNSSPVLSHQDRKIPCEDYHHRPTIAESDAESTQLMPANSTGALLLPEPPLEIVRSPPPPPATNSRFYQKSPPFQPQQQLQRQIWPRELRHKGDSELTRENLFAILDFLHNHRKSVLAVQIYDEEDYIEREKLDDKRKYLEYLKEDAELQISRLKWACK